MMQLGGTRLSMGQLLKAIESDPQNPMELFIYHVPSSIRIRYTAL